MEQIGLWSETPGVVRLSLNTRGRTLADLVPGEHAILEALDLPEVDARRLMELGFVPGSPVEAAHAAPGGDPRVFRADGSEIALRRETASRMRLRE